jgi:hypothetical protein
MIKEVNQTCKRFNYTLGISVKLPEPKKDALKGTSVLNFVVGAGLVAASVIFAQKWCAVIGGLSIASSLVLRHEAKEK